MGNCQTADAVATVIQHADGRLETAYWPLAARQVMAANPGHYVAAIITIDRRRSSSSGGGGGSSGEACKPVRYLKLLSPDDALLAGHFYRLVSFEDVLREFGAKRRVRLSKVVAKKKKEEMRKQRGEEGGAEVDSASSSTTTTISLSLVEETEEEEHEIRVSRHGQWRPSLQTIAEAGSFNPSTLS